MDKFQQDILSFAVNYLTKDFTKEQSIEFSKFCFDQVSINNYNDKKYPKLNITIRGKRVY